MPKDIEDMTNGEYINYLMKKFPDEEHDRSLLTEHELSKSFSFEYEKDTKSTKNS